MKNNTDNTCLLSNCNQPIIQPIIRLHSTMRHDTHTGNQTFVSYHLFQTLLSNLQIWLLLFSKITNICMLRLSLLIIYVKALCKLTCAL